MAKSKKKRLKLEEKPETTTSTTTTGNMDMISSLPDSLLCHILSFLPTRSAMATSILSRRWRHLWNDLQALDLDGEPFDENEKRFVAFVNAVLARRKSRHIRRFRLSGELSQHRAFRRWIRAVTGPHLQELHLSLSVFREDEYEELELPEGVFICKSLVSLVLKRYIDLIYRDFPHVHLPSLKNLEVDVCCVNPDKLLSGCAVVENLKLVLRSIDHRAPSIHMPRSLKSLTLEDDDCVCFDHVEHLEILAPSLEYLRLNLAMIPCSQVSVSDFPHMAEAHLDIYPHDVHVVWVPELLKALRMAKLLVLEAYTVELLLRAPTLDFPEFCRLVHLSLAFPVST